jgi:hypothetical protein
MTHEESQLAEIRSLTEGYVASAAQKRDLAVTIGKLAGALQQTADDIRKLSRSLAGDEGDHDAHEARIH